MEQRRNGTKSPVRRTLFRLIAIIPLGLGLAGCSAAGGSEQGARFAPPSGATVYTTDALAQWERTSEPYDGFRPEYARNDAQLGRRDVVAITAAGQWPEPLRPIERPVVFRLFQQDRSGYGTGYYDRGRGYDRRGYGRHDGRSDRRYRGGDRAWGVFRR